MTLKTVPVTGILYNPDGSVAANAIVVAQLTTVDTDGGVIVPGSVSTTTDAGGVFTMMLWPNSRGVNGSQYLLRGQMPGALPGVLLMNLKITVPDSDPSVPVPVSMITNRTLPSALSDAKAAMLGAQAAAVQAQQALAAILATGANQNVNALAAALANVNALAADLANVDAVAGDLAAINALSSALTALNAIAGDLANINAAAGDLTNINSVAGALASINTAAQNISAIQGALGSAQAAEASRVAIDNRLYPGSASVDPTTRPDGTARQVGDGYFNSGIKAFKYWDGVQWGSYTSSAAAFAAAAAASAAAAAAIVTGGTGALVPAAGKLPVADGSGNIDPLWLKSSPKSRWFGKVASKLSKAITGKVRIGYSGTSIATFNSSPGAVWVAQLQRLFGDSGDRVNYLAFIGGTAQNVAFQGWDKQCFGGPQFARLRGTNVSTAFDIYTTRCRFVAVRYSTETDGGSWSISLNGGAPQAINSAGAQSYRNEVVLDAGFDGIHKLTITPPAGSGVAYFEAYECRTEDNGVFVDNSTFGGSAANNMINGFTNNNGAGVPIIQPVGFTGVDCYFNAATKPDLFVWQYTVNDVGDGSAHFLTDYQSILDRAVTLCRQNDIPLVIIIEPLGHLAFPFTSESQGARDNAAGIRAYQQRVAADNEHVYVLDWHALTFINDVVKYTSVFYPVVVLNGLISYTGDFIHPVQPTGYAPAVMALCAATGVPVPSGLTVTAVRCDDTVDAARGFSASASHVPTIRSSGKGSKHKVADSYGTQHVVTEVGKTITYSLDQLPNRRRAVPIFYSDTIKSSFPGWAAPALSDNYGAYISDANNGGGSILLPSPGYAGFFTVTMLISPLSGGAGVNAASMLLEDPGFDLYLPNGQIAAKAAGSNLTVGLNTWDSTDYPPCFISATYKRNTSVSNTPVLRASGRVYAAWVTPTAFPVVTDKIRGWGTPTEIGPPLYYIGDPLINAVLPGQEVIETINSKDVRKIALDTSVTKLHAIEGSRYRAYRIKTEANVEVIRGQPEFTGTLVAGGSLNAEFGGLIYNIGTPIRILFTALASYAANYQGKTFTLATKFSSCPSGLKFGLLGAGGFAMFAKFDVSGNVVWTEYASATNPATVGDLLVATSSGLNNRNLGFTFVMPALTANMGAGSITPFLYATTPPSVGYSYLADGSSFLL